MKKKTFLIFLLLSLSTLYCQVYYSSNSAGMKLEEIEQMSGSGWILKSENLKNRDLKTLFKDGIEDKKWVTIRDGNGSLTEQMYRNGDLFSIKDFSKDGKIIREVFYNTAGKIIYDKKYNYPSDNIIERSDKSEDSGSEELIRLSSSGNIISLSGSSYKENTSSSPDEGKSLDEKNFYDKLSNNSSNPSHITWKKYNAENQISWNSVDDKVRTIFYNNSGKRVRISEYEKGILKKENIYIYRDGRLASVVEKNITGDTKTVKDINNSGYTILEKIYESDILTSKISYEYDDNGNIVSKTGVGNGKQEKWIWEYKDGKRVRERYFLDGIEIYSRETANEAGS